MITTAELIVPYPLFPSEEIAADVLDHYLPVDRDENPWRVVPPTPPVPDEDDLPDDEDDIWDEPDPDGDDAEDDDDYE